MRANLVVHAEPRKGFNAETSTSNVFPTKYTDTMDAMRSPSRKSLCPRLAQDLKQHKMLPEKTADTTNPLKSYHNDLYLAVRADRLTVFANIMYCCAFSLSEKRQCG